MKMNKRNVTLVTAVCVLIFSVEGCAQPWIRDWLEPKLEEKRAKNAPPTPSASLSAIDLSAGTIAFDPNQTDYTAVEVPFGTTSVTVAGHTNDSGGYVTYSPSPTIMLPGAAGAVSQPVILRASAPGKIARNYTVSFIIGNQNESYLTGLTLSVGALTNDDSSETVDFSQSTYDYYVTVPSGTMSFTVTAQTEPFATVRYRQNSGAEGNNIGRGIPIDGSEKLYITVNNGAGYSDKQYTVNVLVFSNTNTALLKNDNPAGLFASEGALFQDGKTTTVFDQNVLAYRLEVAKDLSSTTITATAPDTNYTVASASPVYSGTHSGSNVLSITVQDPKPSSPPLQILVTRAAYAPTLYTIYFDYAPGNKTDALLSSLGLSESTSFPAFDPEVFVYNASITGSMKPLIITATPADNRCVVTYNPANYLTSPNDGMEIKVTCSGGPEFNAKTYTIRLTVTEDSTSNNLTSLRINGKLIDNANIADTMQPSYSDIGFPAGEFEIEAGIPAGASIAYMGAAPVGGNRAKVAALVAGVPRTVVILVTAQNGSVKAYSLTFYWAGFTENALTRVDLKDSPGGNVNSCYMWFNVPNNINKTVYNISTTADSVTASNITASPNTDVKYSTDGGSNWTPYTSGDITIDSLAEVVAKTLIVKVHSQAGSDAFYTFNIRKYTAKFEYAYRNSPWPFTMPVPGRITIELWGAQGGTAIYSGNIGTGGLGGYLKATTDASVAAGTPLYVYVGQNGNNNSGTTGGAATYGGGGRGGNGFNYAGGGSGGGATFISTALGADITVAAVHGGRVLVAGGGGGGSENNKRGGAGSGGTVAGDGTRENTSVGNAPLGANAGTGNINGIGSNGRNANAVSDNGAQGTGGGGGGYRGGLSQMANGAKSNASGGGGNGYTAPGYTALDAQPGIWAGNGKAAITVTPDMP